MKLLIITKEQSEFSGLLSESFEECNLCAPGELPDTAELDSYDAFAILGGIDSFPLVLFSDERTALERQLKRGAKFFVEYTYAFSKYTCGRTEDTRFLRPVLMDNAVLHTELAKGTLFEEQSNNRVVPKETGRNSLPILQYAEKPDGFYRLPDPDSLKVKESDFALWLEDPKLMICTFRMDNFGAAKFAPQVVWAELITSIVRWLGGECCPNRVTQIMRESYHLSGEIDPPVEVAKKAVQWFEDAGLIVERKGEPYCVLEGLTHRVEPDGTHNIYRGIRCDCAGEASLMYYLKYLACNDAEALRYADGIRRFPMDEMVKTGLHAGMVTWSPSAFFACYQDDVARGFLLPELWRAYLSGDHSRLDKVKLTLDYLLSTTGTDGLRVNRTDFLDPDKEELSCMRLKREEGGKWHWEEFQKYTEDGVPYTAEVLRSIPSGCPSAHYNGTYMASLLFYGKLTGDEKYILAGEKGLETMMSFYPETAREHSQTQELCRLILPLAMLYWTTKDPMKKKWLYRVTDDLMKFRHPNGGFIEWDEGYIACCAGSKDGESSVLSNNGDPVMDLLYSLNWLAFGVCAARIATNDERFELLWKDIAEFFSKTQMVSKNKLLNGAWPRAIDGDHFEVFGIANDIGWSPWSIESGWTVAQIAGGLFLGDLIERGKIDLQEK